MYKSQSIQSLNYEQDIRSPHHHLDSLEEARGRIFLYMGAAEGLISVEVADIAEKIYLFEYDSERTVPLKATFAPWGKKVVLINKKVSNIDGTYQLRASGSFLPEAPRFPCIFENRY